MGQGAVNGNDGPGAISANSDQRVMNENERLNDRDDFGQTALHRATTTQEREKVEKLVAAGALLDIADKNDATPLCYAARHGNVAVMRLLLDAGADGTGPKPAAVAAARGHAHALQLLLDAGASADAKDDDTGETLLFKAVCCRRTSIVRKLLEAGADPDIVDKHGLFPLQVAVGEGYVDEVLLLLKAGASLETILDERTVFHSTALSTAVLEGFEDSARMLLDAGANPSTSSSNGWTALHCAAKVGSVDNIMALCDAGAMATWTTAKQETAIGIATEEGNSPAAEALLSLECQRIDICV